MQRFLVKKIAPLKQLQSYLGCICLTFQMKDRIEKTLKSMKKKQNNFQSPDMAKLQEVIIDNRTRIYIALSADPDIARSRFLSRFGNKVMQ